MQTPDPRPLPPPTDITQIKIELEQVEAARDMYLRNCTQWRLKCFEHEDTIKALEHKLHTLHKNQILTNAEKANQLPALRNTLINSALTGLVSNPTYSSADCNILARYSIAQADAVLSLLTSPKDREGKKAEPSLEPGENDFALSSLPRTNDGTLIYPGLKAWLWCQQTNGKLNPVHGHVDAVYTQNTIRFNSCLYRPNQLFTTKEAALLHTIDDFEKIHSV